MPHIEKHAPGDFCWIELATTDQAAAKNFYSTLFGWATSEFLTGPDDFYTTFKLGGRDVAAAYTLRSDERVLGIPAHWNLYVTVEDADLAAERAKNLGASLLIQPFDVSEFGRMATVQDPTGAVFSIWQPKRHIGFRVKGVPGTFCVADLSTPDQERASRFYEQLFGWRAGREEEDSAHNYYHLFNRDEYIGGILPPAFRDSGAPPHWQIYLMVANCEATAATAKSFGATLYVPPMTIENLGRMAVVADPQGAVFAIFEAAGR